MTSNRSSADSTAATNPGPCSWPWQPDLGNGRFRNPIIHADYSDPDAIRHGDDYFMVSSSFNCTPGLPILHSRDLVNWELINHAVRNLPEARYDEVQPGCGIWAPALRFHAGKFWIFFPMPDEGIYLTTATDPAGQWSEPHLVQAGKGLIDPCPLWDDDGKAYLVHAYAGSRAGIKHRLCVRPMAPDGSRLLGEGQIVFHDEKRHPTLEGPKFLKRDGWYYILAPAGGVATGWQVVLRSRNIFGPYEDRIVLEQGGTPVNGPHQGALVDTTGGDWWFIHFQDAGVYGRILHLQPVRWEEGWPLMGQCDGANDVGRPVLNHAKPAVAAPCSPRQPVTSDEFSAAQFGLQWQWNANHREDWYSLSARPGWLRLFPRPVPDDNLGNAPHLLLQKFPAAEFAAETHLELGPDGDDMEAGLTVMGREYAALALRRVEGTCQLVLRTNGRDTILEKRTGSSVQLRVAVSAGGRCEFSYSSNGNPFTAVPDSFQAVAGVWIGARVGIYSARVSPTGRGHADFDYLRFGPLSAG